MAFQLRAGAYLYRPLKRGLRGWDVVALQTGLLGVGLGLPRYGADGYFGRETQKAVTNFQASSALGVDGIAGIATQRSIGHQLALKAADHHDLPLGVPLGHVEKESGFQLGNYTAPYTNGSRDCGAVQRNTFYHPVESCFDTPYSIDLCAGYTAAKWAEYMARGVSEERALELACGAWNRPAWTDLLSRGGTLSPEASSWIEGYIDRVTTYL